MLNNIAERLLLYDPLLDEIGKMLFLNEKLIYSESIHSEITRNNLLKKTKKSYYLICNSIYNQIEICEGTTLIESHLFDGYNFEKVFIPSSVVDIQDNAFYQCKNLSYVSLKCMNLKSIGKSAFSDCVNLKSLIMPDKVNGCKKNWIWSLQKMQKFKECDQIKQIEFIVNHNVSLEIGHSSFEECKALKKVTFYHSELFDKDQLKIKSFAFKGCINLKQFIFPGNCDGDIGTNCFENCINIEYICPPSNITTISKEMFKNCSNLKTINLCEKEITFIDDGAFDNCEKLCLKSLPLNLRKIGNNAFRKCSLKKFIHLLIILQSIIL